MEAIEEISRKLINSVKKEFEKENPYEILRSENMEEHINNSKSKKKK